MTLPPPKKKGLWGPIALAVAAVVKFGSKLLLLMPFLKFLPAFLKTGGTMILSVGAYALLWGWKFALGFVVLIFVHELGHLVAARSQGLRVGAPVFIPFMGAFIALKDAPRNAWIEAVVGIGGPIFGTIGASVCFLIHVATGDPFWSALAYSGFMLTGLADHVRTSHALVVQWDGFPTRAAGWDPRFLDFDYIGAPWPGAPPGATVGNGGFSLRSRRLLEALTEPGMVRSHPEDLAICVANRPRLESEFGIRFAPIEVAERFSYERLPPTGGSFGFHGLFNWIHEFPTAELSVLLDGLPDHLAAGIDACELIERLITRGDRANAVRLLDMRRRMGMWDRRTLKLWSRLWWAERRSRAA